MMSKMNKFMERVNVLKDNIIDSIYIICKSGDAKI